MTMVAPSRKRVGLIESVSDAGVSKSRARFGAGLSGSVGMKAGATIELGTVE